jgi:hypothetical protein
LASVNFDGDWVFAGRSKMCVNPAVRILWHQLRLTVLIGYDDLYRSTMSEMCLAASIHTWRGWMAEPTNFIRTIGLKRWLTQHQYHILAVN